MEGYKYTKVIERIDELKEKASGLVEANFFKNLRTYYVYSSSIDEEDLLETAEVIMSAESAKEIADWIIKKRNLLYYMASSANLDDKHWYRVREILGDKCHKTDSEAGSLLVSSVDGSFSIRISNGYGDGTTRFAILEKNDDIRNMLRFSTELNGKFNIYDYDCCIPGFHQPMMTIEGRYGVYFYDGMIVFEKWS